MYGLVVNLIVNPWIINEIKVVLKKTGQKWSLLNLENLFNYEHKLGEYLGGKKVLDNFQNLNFRLCIQT